MKSELAEEILELIEARSRTGPTPAEFEMAYQARVAIDRIQFAIKHTEQFAPRTDELREAQLQLLDALERLERVDRRFQLRSIADSRSFSNAEQTTLGVQRRRRQGFTTMTQLHPSSIERDGKCIV